MSAPFAGVEIIRNEAMPDTLPPNQIYCDYAATAPLRPEVQETMLQAGQLPGNPSSIHRSGQVAKVLLERARQTAADALGAEPREIVFTSGGTEANNTVFPGLLGSGDHVVTSMTEHPSVQRPLERLEPLGISVTQVAPQANGMIQAEDIEAALRPNTRLISVMCVNNETGAVADLDALGDVARRHGLLLHTDAVQALGKTPLDVNRSGIHFLSASAHKIGGPKGTGLLYARKGTPFHNLIAGGSQENSHRGGTENVAGIAGFARAIEIAMAEYGELHSRLIGFRKILLGDLDEGNLSYKVNATGAIPGIVNLQFPGVNGQALVMNLDGRGYAVSYGSSCASGSSEASHVLLAMGLTQAEATSAIRVSFGYATTREEVLGVAAALGDIVGKLQGDSLHAGKEATVE